MVYTKFHQKMPKEAWGEGGQAEMQKVGKRETKEEPTRITGHVFLDTKCGYKTY